MKLVSLVKMARFGTHSRVRVETGETQPVKVVSGLRQRDPLPPVLFNTALEKKKSSNTNREGLLFDKRHQCLAFAGDVALITRSRQELT